MTYDDPRLAVVYDVDKPDGPDHDFFRALADRVGATSITDLGCGTGILTVTLATDGRQVTGINPAPAMLERAKGRTGGDQVLAPGDIRTDQAFIGRPGDHERNVAMHITGSDWRTTLDHIAAGLRPGGMLVVESRNPEARACLQWNDPPNERANPVGMLRESVSTDPPDADGVVVMHVHNEFLDAGERLDFDQQLQFRSYRQIVQDLAAAGLRVSPHLPHLVRSTVHRRPRPAADDLHRSAGLRLGLLVWANRRRGVGGGWNAGRHQVVDRVEEDPHVPRNHQRQAHQRRCLRRRPVVCGGAGSAALLRMPPEGVAQYVEFRFGPDEDELGIMDATFRPGEKHLAGPLVYLQVDDVAAALDRLVHLGATAQDPVLERGDGFMTASFIDPFGNHGA